jgi:hypothetical protein
MRVQWIVQSILAVAGSTVLAACTTTSGGFRPNTQFVYPNSNVKILGPTSAELSKWGVLFFVPSFSPNEIYGVYDQALKKHAGADILVNFDEGVTTTSYLGFVTTLKYVISGDAAQMEVGKQQLR